MNHLSSKRSIKEEKWAAIPNTEGVKTMKYAAQAIVLILAFAINAQAQELTRDSPAASVTTYQNHTVTFAVWASGLSDDQEWDHADWYIDGWNEYTTPMSGQTDYVSWSKKFDTQGVYQVSVDAGYINNGGVLGGPLVDLDGRTGKISWTVYVNSTDPIVTRVSPDSDVTVELGSTEIFYFEARDPGGDLWRGLWYYDGVQVGESRLFGSTTDGQYPYTFDTPGKHELKLVVRDSVSFTDEISWEVTVNQSIIVNHGGPYAGTVYQAVQFDGSGSTDPDGTIVSYLWDFGDGSTGTGARPSHAYIATGNYTVVLLVTDNDGATAYAETSASIGSIANRGPNAVPGGPYHGHVGQVIQFDGSLSEDEGGTIVSYLWNFGDGTTGTGVNPSHIYTEVGQYTVTLTVTDNDGVTHTAATTSSIPNTPPVANPGGPYTGYVGEPVFFDGSGSTDLEGGIVTYHWYFYDENTGSGPNPTHSYTSAGTYSVSLTVTDNDGATDTAFTSAVISETPNVLTLSVSILANSMSENGGSSEAIVMRSSGTSESLVVNLTSSDASEAMVPASITIPVGSDSATFTVTAIDDTVLDGSQTVTITAAAAGANGGMDVIEVIDDEVVQVNQSPVAAAGGPYAGYTIYLPVIFDGSNSHDSDGTIVSYEWDFGDGSFGTGVAPSHYYQSSGEYTATLTVTDDTGQTDIDTTTVYIESLAPPEPNPGGPYAGQGGEPVQFDGSGSYDPDGSIVSYEWDFGDGTNATGISPAHIYTAAAIYTVTLKVVDDDGNYAQFTTTAVITQADNQHSESNRYIDIAAGYDYSLAIKQDGSIVGWGNNEFGQADPPEGNDYVALAVCVDGGHHGLALRAGGSMAGWGDNQYGQADPPAGNNFIAIAAGRKHSLALKSDGSIIAWGDNANGQINLPAGNDFIAIAAGTGHSLALKSDGSILAWGRNTNGQSDALAGNDFVAITSGGQFSLALKTDGSIVAWGGKNTFGQASPPAGNDFVAVSAGKFHALALKSDGSITGWGYDQYGQAGPPTGNDFIKTACGGRHSLALKSDGTIVGFGLNEYGQLTPPGKDDIIDIAAGYYHSLALKRDGSIIGWGDNEFGQSSPPTGNDFIAIAVGAQGNHSLALRLDGSIVGWGDNEYGQADPPAGNDFIAIAAGFRHSLALKSDGSIIAWGRNNFGQSTPPAGNDFVAIAAGTAHSIALKSDGSIVAWGRNVFNQSSPPAGNDFVAITAGEQFSLALKTDGSIVGWGGKNTYGQINPPAGNDFVAIAAGKFHALALKSDGSIVAWGSNTLNQATPPAGFNFVAIAVGDSHSLAVKADGTIVGWGDNIGGQIDVPEGNDI
jgi:alpha-tubulin suppressor-like RCC1 family protein/chitodextrinase